MTRTINRWLVTSPDFREAVKQGRELADAQVARALYLKATGQWTQPAVKIAQDRDPAGRHARSSPSTSCPTSSTSRPTPRPPSSGSRTVSPPRLSCHAFRHNAVRLQLHALAYNLANFMRTLALPEEVEHWSLTTLREKLVKIGARIVRHGRYVVFQLAEVAVPRSLFADILRRIDHLRPKPPPLPA